MARADIKGYPLAEELVQFISKRETLRRRKEAGRKAPWSDDPILNTYRFCNVHREDDRVTKWIAENWREPHKTDPHLWFAMVVARLFNLPETLEAIGYPVPFNPKQMQARLDKRKATGANLFNAAYIVSTNGVAQEKTSYLIERVLTPLWEARTKIRPRLEDTLESWHHMLTEFDGLGSFMAAQVVADMKYAPPLNNATDWWTFASSGPGSRRGLNRAMGVPPEAGWRKGAWEEALSGLHKGIKKRLMASKIVLHAQDLQNCLCEFDKYRRAVEGGAPKQFYKEHKDGV